MVERLFERLAAPIRGLHQAAYVLALLTLASQVLALLRDRTFAAEFGAGPVLDLYYSAFRIPDLVFALVASLVSAYVLIPRIAGGDQAKTRELLSQSVSFLLIGGGILCGVLALFTPQLLALLYPTFASSPYQSEFILLTRLLLVQPIILGISGILTSVTQVHRRFILFALSPVLYNLGIIFGALVLYPSLGLPGIGAGVLLGAFLHALLHVPVVARAGVLPRLIIPSYTAIIDIARDSLPRSLALGMGSFTLLALTALASRVGEGAVSVFTLASNLEAVPLALIGASYAVAAFPALSEHSAAENREGFAQVLSASARHIILWSLVSLGLIVVLRAHLVRVILGAGVFDWDATRLTAALLAICAAGLVAQGLVLLFSRALYAAKQSWWPLMYQVAGAVVSVGMAWYLLTFPPSGLLEWLSVQLRVSDVSGTAILFVAISATLGQILLALWSLIVLARGTPSLVSSLARPLVHGIFTALLGGVATYGALMIGGEIAPLTTLLAVFAEGLAAGMVGLAASALVLYVLKNEEFIDVLKAFSRLPGIRNILPPLAEEPVQP
ncbi:MAG: lipid II flippase MurJ [bacterium]|nr:lipid II flippase MurJ [bacterium]